MGGNCSSGRNSGQQRKKKAGQGIADVSKRAGRRKLFGDLFPFFAGKRAKNFFSKYGSGREGTPCGILWIFLGGNSCPLGPFPP